MRVLFLTGYPLGAAPGQRFRLEHYLSTLDADGIEWSLRTFWSQHAYRHLFKAEHALIKFSAFVAGMAKRARDIIQAGKYDVVYVYREACPLGPPLFESFIDAIGKPMMFDFDDAIYLSNASEANQLFSRLKYPRKTADIVRMSTITTVGNPWLAEYASQFTSKVVVIPTTVDTDLYQPRCGRNEGRLVLGWTGSMTTIQHLRLLDDVLKRLQQKYPVDIRVIGSRGYSIPGVDVLATDWNGATELEDLAAIDIGIMPLPDDEWARGKCGLKALQCMAMGIPTVCSPVGVNPEIVDYGRAGRLASTEEEWFAVLSELIEDAALRRDLGQAGRARVESEYSVKRWAPVFASTIRQASGVG